MGGRWKSVLTVMGAATVLAAPQWAAAQAWSPDGSRIAYWFFEPEDIWLVGPDGSGKCTLVGHEERDFAPQWHPDGQSLVFTSIRDGYHAVYSVGVNGHDLERLTPEDSESSDGTLSPDGRWLAYSSDRSGDSEIWIERIDGSTAPRQLTNRVGMDTAPRFSPDGRQILYASWADGEGDLRLIDVDGHHDRALTGTSDIGEFHPSWSPDGQVITFIAPVDGELALMVINADGTGRRTVRRVPGRQHFYPNFSPDGEWIAFFGDSADEEHPIAHMPALMKVRVDGTEETRIISR